MSLRPRSRNAASSSPAWCGLCAASPTHSRSSRANGAGARRNARSCHENSGRHHRSDHDEALSSRSSRTCSAPSQRDERRPAFRRSRTITVTATTTSPRWSQEPRARDQYDALLQLSGPLAGYVRSASSATGHARMLIGQPNAEELAEEIISRDSTCASRGHGAQGWQGAGQDVKARRASAKMRTRWR